MSESCGNHWEKFLDDNLDGKLNNLKITAHIAWASSEAQQRLIHLLSDNIAAYKCDKKLNRLA